MKKGDLRTVDSLKTNGPISTIQSYTIDFTECAILYRFDIPDIFQLSKRISLAGPSRPLGFLFTISFLLKKLSFLKKTFFFWIIYFAI